MSRNYIYKTSDNNNINITTYGNENLENGNCIVFVHGFKGFKDWGFGPYLGEYFASKGYFVITFNFSHNGIKGNSIDFNELDRFANNTYSREIEEIGEIVKAYKNNFFGAISSSNKIGILGHSRGGGDAIISANLYDEIDALATWAAIADFDRFSQRQKKDWKEKGFLEIINARTNQTMRLNKILLEDIEKNSKDLLNTEKSLNNLSKPYLIIHGDQDLAVPIKEAEQIYSWSDKNHTDLFKISGTGHTFDIKHPFEGPSEVFIRILEKTDSFFNNTLMS